MPSRKSPSLKKVNRKSKNWALCWNHPLGDTFHLVEGENRVGRSASNEIHIPAEKLSRHHARLLLAGDNLEVIDLGSTNGTFVNDARLEKNQPTPLKPGDDIRFGDHSYQVNTSK